MPALRDVTIRPPADAAERTRHDEIIYQSFAGFGLPVERTTLWGDFVGNENLRVAVTDAGVSAGLGILYFGQWFGGRSVASAGITAVGVAPEARGSGVGATMMRGVIRELHERGRALCALFPSTYGLYRKAGFEPAGTRMIYKLKLSTLDVRERGLAVRPMTDADLPAVEEVHRARARIANGNVDRGPKDWQRVLKFGMDRIYAYVVEGAGGAIEGFIVFNQEGKPRAAFEIILRDLAATTPRAARRLLTFLGQHTTMCEHAYYFAGPADTILMQAPEEWNEIDHRMQWMLRVVNVEEALRQRGYPPGLSAEVELEVEDDLIAANSGRFVLRVRDGVAEVERGGAGRVRMGIRGLAPLFASQLSALQLAQMGQAGGEERDLAVASAVFAGPAPWMGDRF